MKTKILIPALVVGAIVTFFSCKKDSDKSKTEYLTQAGWKYVKSETDPGTGTYVDDPLDACEKDDIIKFNADGSANHTVGTKCDPSDPDEKDETGTWSFGSGETTLTIVTPSGGAVGTIEALDNDRLVIGTSFTFGGVTSRYRDTYGH